MRRNAARAVRIALVAIFLLSVVGGFSQNVRAQAKPDAPKAVHLIGLTGVKDNKKGRLTADNGQLHFVYDKTSTNISATSIEDVVTGADSEKAVGKTIGLVSMAAPYGGGRFLSLFRKKIDTLTVKYRDDNGGLHGAIFTMPAGTAEAFKGQLVAQGARTSIPATPASDDHKSESSKKEPR